MSKVLVVVYSYTGTSRRLAQLLAGQERWPVGEVLDAKPRRGNWRCIWDSLLRRRPPITYDGPDPAGFDAVVLVSPIWAARLAGPMRSFVALRRAVLPNVAVVSVMGNKGAPGAVAEVADLIGRRPVQAAAFTSRQIEDGSFAQDLKAFAEAVQRSQEQAEVVTRPAVWSTQAG